MRTPVLRPGSAWQISQVERFLAESEIPVRLGCVTRSGGPLVCSLWYLYEEGRLWCATQADAALVAMLRHDPRCAFEVAGDRMPYRGVRGGGRAVLSGADGPAVLGRLVERYLHERDSAFARWLLSRQDEEVAIRIDCDWLTSWDFSRRMSR